MSVRAWKTEDGKKNIINDSCQSKSVMKTGSVLFPTNIKMEPLTQSIKKLAWFFQMPG